MFTDTELKYLQKHISKFNLCSSSCFITGADLHVFEGLQILRFCIPFDVNFLCYDFGLTLEQKNWCEKNNLTLRQLPNSPINKNIQGWQTYYKPWLIKDSPYDYNIWIDTDCIIMGDLNKAELIQTQQTFFVNHWIQENSIVHNSSEIYLKFPTNYNKNVIRVNAGVFGIHKNDSLIIDEWINILSYGFEEDITLLYKLAAWDEGALCWSLEKNNAFEFITDDYRYNTYTSINTSEFSKVTKFPTIIIEGCSHPLIFLKNVVNQPQNSFILHFATCMENKKKYWHMWK